MFKGVFNEHVKGNSASLNLYHANNIYSTVTGVTTFKYTV